MSAPPSPPRGRRAIGVMGGLGPAATLDFFAKALAATPAARDQDHARWIVDCDPSVPDRNEAVAGRGPSPGPALGRMARGLERAGAECLVMVCNAAHAFRADIGAACRLPFLSILDATVEEALAARPGARRVGVLAAAAALDAGLYRDAFAAHGVEALEPVGAERARFMELLYRIKGGDRSEGARAAMRELAGGLVAAGAEAVVAGCTEVPLVLGARDPEAPLVSSTDALVRAAVAVALGERPLPSRAADGRPAALRAETGPAAEGAAGGAA